MLDSISTTAWTLIGLFLTTYCVPAYIRSINSPLRKVPTVGPSGILTSYYGVLKSVFGSSSMMREGYEKYYGGSFKIPMLSRWMVVVTGPQLFDELRKGTEDVLSFQEAVGEMLQAQFTLGKGVLADPYHNEVVRVMLTRNMASRFDDVQDEVACSVSENIPAKEGEWLNVPAYDTIVQIVCRTSNRLFVGLPICRDPDYRQLNIAYTMEVAKSSFIITQFPPFLRPFASKIFTNTEAYVKRAIRHLEPMLQERLDRFEEFGVEDTERPNDLISWLLDYAKPQHRTVYDLTARVLTVNFAAIHTTSMALTHVLYDLALRPEYAEPLRQEIISVLGKDDWTKTEMTQLRKLDSFIKESQRLSGSNAVIMTRLAKRDFEFSDGTIVPKGHWVAFPSEAMHSDERVYGTNSHEFQGFRFAEMREAEGEGIKHQAVSLSVNWTVFGGGKHGCPGRFFAINEIKTIMAYLLLNYDIKLEDGSSRPKTFWFGVSNIPNPKARLLFRKRKVE